MSRKNNFTLFRILHAAIVLYKSKCISSTKLNVKKKLLIKICENLFLNIAKLYVVVIPGDT